MLLAVACSSEGQANACNIDYADDTVRFVGAEAAGLVGDSSLGAAVFECRSARSSALIVLPRTFSDATVGGPQPIETATSDGSFICVEPATPVPEFSVPGLPDSGAGPAGGAASVLGLALLLAGGGALGLGISALGLASRARRAG